MWEYKVSCSSDVKIVSMEGGQQKIVTIDNHQEMANRKSTKISFIG